WSFLRKNILTDAGKAIQNLRRVSSRKARRKRAVVARICAGAGIDPESVRIEFVEHHLAHASSAYHLSGFPDAAIMTIDGRGEMTTALFAEGEAGAIRKIHEVLMPDSLGHFYSGITEFLGFEAEDGEYKTMGMAPFGDARKADLSGLLRIDGATFHVDTGA